jgi:toxin secretion/phage lysis holin
MSIKEGLCAIIGVVGGLLCSAFGGFDVGLITLLIFMGIDYASGLILAGVFKKSKKTECGALESAAGFKGLVKKGMCLVFVLIGHQLDTFIGSSFVRDAVIIAFITNELISIVENAGVMGVPVPAAIRKSIEILNRKEKGDSNDE